MDFSNNIVSPADLPQIENVRFNPLEKQYLTVMRIAFFITFGVIGAVVAAGLYFIHALDHQWWRISAIATYLLLLALTWIANTLSFRFSGYALRDKDILFRSGWFIQKTRVVPVSRVQHVSVQSGPIERAFKLASISLFTAGSGHADFTISGLGAAKATQVRDWLNEKIKSEDKSERAYNV